VASEFTGPKVIILYNCFPRVAITPLSNAHAASGWATSHFTDCIRVDGSSD
jgi:hypothetical protein